MKMNKSIESGFIKSLSAEGLLTGYGATFGNVDLQGDVIMPGAFTESLDDFVKHGALCMQHKWDQRIGTIETAREDGRGLYFEARFHTTQLAQELKKIVKERIDRGKSVALSIGFKVLKDALGAKGRELHKLHLYEISLVTVGANPLAMAVGVKMLEADVKAHTAARERAIDDMWHRFSKNRLAELEIKSYKNRIADLEGR